MYNKKIIMHMHIIIEYNLRSKLIKLGPSKLHNLLPYI